MSESNQPAPAPAPAQTPENVQTGAPGEITDAALASELLNIDELGNLPTPSGTDGQSDSSGGGGSSADSAANNGPEGALSEPDPAVENTGESVPPPTADNPPDADLQRRLDAIARAEQQRNERLQAQSSQLDQRIAEFEARQAEWQMKISKFEEASARAAYDPAGALEALGVSPDSFEDVAKAIYETADPSRAGNSRQALAMREAMAMARKAQEEARAAQEQFAQYQRQQESSRYADRYMSEVYKKVGDSAPTLSTMIESDRGHADGLLREEAARIAQETGEVPDPSDVVASLEKYLYGQRSAYAKMYGLTVPTEGQKIETPSNATEIKPATTLSSDIGNTATAKPEPKTMEEIEADIIRAMQAGNLNL